MLPISPQNYFHQFVLGKCEGDVVGNRSISLTSYTPLWKEIMLQSPKGFSPKNFSPKFHMQIAPILR